MRRLVVAIVLLCLLASPAWSMDDKAIHAMEIFDSTNGGTVEVEDPLATVGGGLVVYFLRTQFGGELRW